MFNFQCTKSNMLNLQCFMNSYSFKLVLTPFILVRFKIHPLFRSHALEVEFGERYFASVHFILRQI